MRLDGHLARTRERKDAYRAFVGKPEEKDHLEEPGVNGRILKMDLQDVLWGAGTGLIWLSLGTGGGLMQTR